MKFQNPSFKIFERTGGHRRTNGRTSRKQYAPHFFKVGGINSGNTVFSIIMLSVAMGTRSRIWPNFKLIQALMFVIVTCKYEIDLINNSREKEATPIFPL